jgi:thymidine kinase
MITLITGAKGSGKTKKIIFSANEAAVKSKGDVVYVTDNAKHSVEIKHTVRFVDAKEFGINSAEAALGFLKGILSVNNDITHVFIDGLARISGAAIEDMEDFYKELETLSQADNADFIITVSCDEKLLPRYMKKYI